MAFQLGDTKIKRTIDGISFYPSIFGWLVRMKGGPTRKQFKTSPSFERSRENSSEFTACSKAASALRHIIIKHTSRKDKTLYHRLITLMRLLANHDTTSPRGHRDPMKGMQNLEGLRLLKSFEVTSVLNLYELLLVIGHIKAPKKKTTLRKKKQIHIFRTSTFKINPSPQKPNPFNTAFG